MYECGNHLLHSTYECKWLLHSYIQKYPPCDFYSFSDMLDVFYLPLISFTLKVYLCVFASFSHIVVTLMIHNDSY